MGYADFMTGPGTSLRPETMLWLNDYRAPTSVAGPSAPVNPLILVILDDHVFSGTLFGRIYCAYAGAESTDEA